MREINYKVHGAYAGSPAKRKAPLSEFVLDIPYLMQRTGVIPPHSVLNEVLLTGGNNGGMGPGTTWHPFSISDAEYEQFVEALLNLDIAEARKNHPYVFFQRWLSMKPCIKAGHISNG